MGIDAMKQALEALEYAASCVQSNYMPDKGGYDWDEVMDTLRIAIAEAESRASEQAEKQEPLGYWNAVEGWVELPEETPKPTAWVYPEALEAFRQGKPWTAYGLNGEGYSGSDGIKRIPLYTTPPAALTQDDMPKIGCVNHDCDKCKAAEKQEPHELLCICGASWNLHADGTEELMSTPPAAPVQEPKQSEIFCGVDFAEGVLSVSVLRRRPDDVAEFLHSEQIDLSLPAAQRQWVSLTDEEMEKISVENDMATFLNDGEETYILWFDGGCFALLKAAEAKLKEKNGF